MYAGNNLIQMIKLLYMTGLYSILQYNTVNSYSTFYSNIQYSAVQYIIHIQYTVQYKIKSSRTLKRMLKIRKEKNSGQLQICKHCFPDFVTHVISVFTRFDFKLGKRYMGHVHPFLREFRLFPCFVYSRQTFLLYENLYIILY